MSQSQVRRPDYTEFHPRWYRTRLSTWRMELLSDHEGIWGCTFVGECTKACPKHVDPAGAIQRYKVKAAMAWMKAFFMPWGAR